MNNYEGGNPTYSVWKKSFLKRFHDEADIQRLRTKLTQLKQHADQRARAYVARLDSLYIAINGKDIVLNEGADANSKHVTNIIIKMRDKERMNILLRGLLPKLKTEVWRRISLNPDYKILCNTVYESEGILLSQDLTERNPVRTVEDIALEIEVIRKKLENLNLNCNGNSQDKDIETASAIAHVDIVADLNQTTKSKTRQDQTARFYARKGRSPSAPINSDRSRDRSRSRNRNSRERSQSEDEEDVDTRFQYRSSRAIECYYCFLLGHRFKKCPIFRNDQQ